MSQRSDASQILHSPPDGDIVQAVRIVLRSYGRNGQWLQVAQMAKLAGMSTRSFQRRLRTQSAAYSDLVDQIRIELANDLLEDSNWSLGDIAVQLGYVNQANFSRAYLRWTGTKPSDVRANSKPNGP